ncbi:helix-turn-helix domain-containing protein [Curtobacterium flaccumfaciens]|uniref:helix-turn-helix domain-containing protein n=1 Tax=Curtobacterium flaccumfaciens TaxID=2035 RepID=UPI003B00E2C3
MTFPQWRAQARLYEALILLGSGGNVRRVGHACGWSSTSAFIVEFRRAFDQTPREYARALPG